MAAGQAAPHGAGGDVAAAGGGLPGSPGTHVPVGGCWGRCLGMAGLGGGVTHGCEAPRQQVPVAALAGGLVVLWGGLSSPGRLFPFTAALRARPTLGRLRKQPGKQIRAGAHPGGGRAEIYTGAFSRHRHTGLARRHPRVI